MSHVTCAIGPLLPCQPTGCTAIASIKCTAWPGDMLIAPGAMFAGWSIIPARDLSTTCGRPRAAWLGFLPRTTSLSISRRSRRWIKRIGQKSTLQRSREEICPSCQHGGLPIRPTRFGGVYPYSFGLRRSGSRRADAQRKHQSDHSQCPPLNSFSA